MMTVTVENTQVYAAIPSIEALVQDFFNFPTLAEYEATQEAVAREFANV